MEDTIAGVLSETVAPATENSEKEWEQARMIVVFAIIGALTGIILAKEFVGKM